MDAQDRPMMDAALRLRYLDGLLGRAMAVSNTPAVRRMEDASGVWGIVYVPAILESVDATGDHDLRLFRLDVRTGAEGLEATVREDFDGLVPGGSASATSPTLSRDGSKVFVGDDHGVLHAFDGETGAELWATHVGPMFGSVSEDWAGTRAIYAGVSDRLTALDPATGELLWSRSYLDVAQARVAPLEGHDRAAMVDGILVVTPHRILVPLVVGYRFGSLSGDPDSQRGFLWPMASLLLVTDRSGEPISTPVHLPDVMETGTVVSRSGRLVIEFGATMSSLAHCIWRNYGSSLARGLPEPIPPVGGTAAFAVEAQP